MATGNNPLNGPAGTTRRVRRHASVTQARAARRAAFDDRIAAGTWVSGGRAVQDLHWDASLEGSTSGGFDSTGCGPWMAAERGEDPTTLIEGAIGVSDPDATMVDFTPAGAEDAALVGRVLDGDRDAMAEMYDRFADRINTMCVHMLRDEDEAADVCGQVFLTALQRLHQLRDPAKLRPWLFAITRNEVYKRSRDRARVRPMNEVDDMQALSIDPDRFETASPDATAEMPGADPARLAALIQVAAGGLDDRDRMVLELNLTEGLDGEELADALGVKVDNAYQLTHRMKERLERSMSALLVVSSGRDLCPDLDGVAKKWDGNYDVLWRKRFARHVDRCERCTRMKAKLPKAVLAGAVLSQAAASAAMAAPISVRERVLTQGPSVVGTETAKPWSSDGFPRRRSRNRRVWQFVAAGAFALFVVIGLSGPLAEGVRDAVEGPATTGVTIPDQTEVPSTAPGPGVPSTGNDPAQGAPGTNGRGNSTTSPGETTTTVTDGTTTVPESSTTTTTTTVTEGTGDGSGSSSTDPSTNDPKYPSVAPLPMPTFTLPPVYFPTTTAPKVN